MKACLALLLVALCCSAVYADGLDEQINQALAAFQSQFLNRPPFNQYLLSVQITTLGDEKEHHNDIQLSHDETWESWCLDVTVGVTLPADIANLLPPTFWEFKVFYNPINAASSDLSSEESSEIADSSDEGLICNMIAYVCPNDLPTSRLPDCGWVCGAQPIGGLTYDEVDTISIEFKADFPASGEVTIETLIGKDIKLTPAEKPTDYCISVAMAPNSPTQFPAVYNGVRVITYNYVCSQRVCEDGSVVGCDDVCPEEEDGNSVFVPLAAIIFIVTLCTCCCYLRGRRKLRTVAPPKEEKRAAYPSEAYELLRQQEEQIQQDAHIAMMMSPHMMPVPMMSMPPMMMPMSPNMAAQMGLPPMPPVPPTMMMPNGSFPVMMQAPNGMWYPAPVHPEEPSN